MTILNPVLAGKFGSSGQTGEAKPTRSLPVLPVFRISGKGWSGQVSRAIMRRSGSVAGIRHNSRR